MNLSASPYRLEAAEDAAFAPVRASRFLSADDAGRLGRFFLGFDLEARHSRFGDAVSDQEIMDYCDGIAWQRSLLIARAGPRGLEAVVEIHPLSQQWDCAELIAACPDADERHHILAQLLQIAAFAAAQRGCRTLLVPHNDTAREMLPLLQGMGRVRIASTQACVDLGGPAAPRDRARSAATWLPPASADFQIGA